MGWLFMYDCRTKQDLVDHLVNNFKFTDTAVRGNVLYGVTATVRNVTDNFGDLIQVPDGGRVIIICLLSCDRSNRNYPMWGYKDMDEGLIISLAPNASWHSPLCLMREAGERLVEPLASPPALKRLNGMNLPRH